MSYSGYMEQTTPEASFSPAAGYGVQAKLKVSQPGDPLEQEADQMAERVVSSPASGSGAQTSAPVAVQRKCDACGSGAKDDADKGQHKVVQRQGEEEGEAPQSGDSAEAEQDEDTTAVDAKLIQAKTIHRTAKRDSRDKEQDEEKIDSVVPRKATASGGVAPVAAPVAAQIQGIKNSGGHPLPRSVRRTMEPHFGRSLESVRVHTDGRAARTAGAIKARAYTLGRDVVFNSGEYQPETIQGRRLLAHELTHVVQQGGA